MNKKAEILQENIIFIVLNIVFFAMIISFLYVQSSSVHLSEEQTAKQIALLIDASKPGTEIEINFADFFAKAEKEGVERGRSIEIDNEKNLINVRGSKKSFYEYSYFNNVDVEYTPKEDNLVLVIK